MPPRKRKIQADANDDKPIRTFLLESYTFLKKFEKSVAGSIRDQPSTRSPSVNQIAVYRRLLDAFASIKDHSPDDLEADRKLILESDGWCDFFRNQITSLYALPIKHIFQPTKKNEIILSSPLLGLMSYIYHVKLKECWARQWTSPGARFLNDKKSIGECWENILSAFGSGIRIHVNNATPGPKLIEFQELAAKVLFEFVSKVMRCDETDRAVHIADHVKRSLLDAVDALSGGCAANKELIRSPNILGPSLLSTIIWEHSDFMTANIALQLAFTVAPPLKSGHGKGKKATSVAESRKSRVTWFEQIFPAVTFGKDIHEELVSRVVDMASQKFWNEIGGIQGRIVRDHDMKARAMPIISGSINGKRICWNEHTTPVFRNCVQFNKSTLTWCSSELLGEKPDDMGEEKTSEIHYEHFLNVQLTLRDAEKSATSGALTLTIDCKDQPVVDGFRPSSREDQAMHNCRSRVVLTVDAQYDILLARTLKSRKIKFSSSSGSPGKLIILEKAHHGKNNDNARAIKTSGIDGDQKPNMPKVSISREPVCALEADDIQRTTKILPQISSSYERAATVQREARSDISREEDTILNHGKSLSTILVDQHTGIIQRTHEITALGSLIHPHDKKDLQSVVEVTSDSSSKDTLISKPGPTQKGPRSALEVSEKNLGLLDSAPKIIQSPGSSVLTSAVCKKTNERAQDTRMQASVHAETSVIQPRQSAVANRSPEGSIEILCTGSQKTLEKTKSKIVPQELPTGLASVPKVNGKDANLSCHRGSENLTGKTREAHRIQPTRSSHLTRLKNREELQIKNGETVNNMPIILRLSDIEDRNLTKRREENYSGASTHSAARDRRTRYYEIKSGHHDAFESDSSEILPEIEAKIDNDLCGSSLPASVVQKDFRELATTEYDKQLHKTLPKQLKRPTSSTDRARSTKDDAEREAWEATKPNDLKLEGQKRINIKEKPLARLSYKKVDSLSEKADDVEDFSNSENEEKREWRPAKTMIEQKGPRNAACAKENQAKIFGRGRIHELVVKSHVNSTDSSDVEENYSGTKSSGSTSPPNMTKDDCPNLVRIPSKFGGDMLKNDEGRARIEQREFSGHLRCGGGSDQSESTEKSIEMGQFPSSPLRRHSSAFKNVVEVHPKKAAISQWLHLDQSVSARKAKDLCAPENIAERPELNKSKRNRQLRFESPEPVCKRPKVVDSTSNKADPVKKRKDSRERPKGSRDRVIRLSEGKKPQKLEAKHTSGKITPANSQTRLFELAKLIDEARSSGKRSGVDLLHNEINVEDGNSRFDDAHHNGPLNTESKGRTHRSSRLPSPEVDTPLFRPKSSPLQKPKEKGHKQSLCRDNLLKKLNLPNADGEVSPKKANVRISRDSSKKDGGSGPPKHEQDMLDCMGKLTQMVIDNIGRKKTNTKRAAFHTQLGVLRLTKKFMRECIQQSEDVLNATLEQANQRQKQYDEFHTTIKGESEKMDREVKWMKKFLKGRDQQVS